MRREILLNIDVAKAPVFNREFVVRNGDSLRLNVCMFEHGKVLRLDNQVIRTYVRKSDGSLLVQKEDIDIISENEFQVKLKNSATNVSGLCYMELEIQDPEDASVVVATNPILFEVEDRIGDVEDAIKAVDDIYLLGEIEKFIIQAKIDMALLKEQIAQGQVKINEFNEFIVQKSSELENKINDAISQIDKKTTDAKYELDVKSTECVNYIKALGDSYQVSITNIGEQYLENMARKADEVIASIIGQKEDIDAYIEEKKDEVQEICDYNASLIEEKKDNALNEIANAKKDAVGDLDDFKDFVKDKTQEVQDICDFNASLIEEKKESALNKIDKAKDDALSEINEISNTNMENLEEIADEKKAEVQSICNSNIVAMNQSKESALSEINQVKGNALSEIDTKGNEKVEQINQIISGSVASVEEAESKALANIKTKEDKAIESITSIASEKVEELDSIEVRADKKIEDINSLIDIAQGIITTLTEQSAEGDELVEGLNDLIETCNTLKANLEVQNNEANSNINELNALHPQSDERIETLRALIEDAKRYEEVVRRWIDNNKDGNIANEEVLLALELLKSDIEKINNTFNNYYTKEEVNELISSIDIPSVEGLATEEYVDNKIEESLSDIEVDVDLSDYATKGEVERLIAGISGGFVGSLGAGLYTPDTTEHFNEVPMPDFKPTATFKYTHMYYTSTYDYYVYDTVIYFKTNIEDLDAGKYIYFDNQWRINYSKLVENEDYVMYIRNALSSTSKWELTSKREFYPNPIYKRTRVYSHDFNIYDETGLNIVYQDTTRGGINDLDKATKSGDYSIDMSEEDFNSLLNGVKVGAGKHITGTLNVKVVGANTIQTLKLDSINKSYTRIIGQDWTDVDNNSIQKESIALIGNNPIIEMSPYFNDVPKMPLYGQKVDKVVKICDNNAWYYVFYLLEGWDATNPIFYVGEGGYIYLNVPQNKCLYYRRLVNSNGVGEWQEYLLNDTNNKMDYISSSRIDKITVYESPLPFRKNKIDGEIYHNAVIRNDSLKVINNFDNAKITGNYEVSYTEKDEVLNAPVSEFSGVLEVTNAGDKIYQEIKSVDNTTAYKRVFNDIWSEWRASNVNADDIYIKEDIDEKISDIRAYVDDFRGAIGKAVKTATMPNNVFDNVPVPAERDGYEYIGRLLCFDGSSYRATYLYNYAERGYYPLFHTSNKTEDAYMYATDASSTYKTVITYTKPTSANANWSGETYTFSSMYLDRHSVKIYENTVPIYLNANKDGIYREPSVGEFIGDLDSARQTGKYFVDIKKDDFKDILNMPPVKIKNDIITTLNVSKKDNVITQEITIEGVSYTRKIGGSWSCKDESYLVKTDVLAKIKGAEVSSYNYPSDNVKAIFDKCPVMVHHNAVHYIDCKTDVDKYARIYITATNNPMFYLFVNSSSAYIGATTNTAYAQAYTYSNGVWSAYNYAYVSAKLTEYKIYHNTLPICQGTSSSNYDKNTILFEASSDEAEKVITDFNDAKTYGVYNVEIAEGTFCANPPVNTAINGILEVVIVGERIIQTLTTANNTVYKRVLNGNWTQWKEEAEAERIGLISSSEEEGAITDFNNAIYHKIYEVYQVGWVLENAPTNAVIEGILTVNETNRYITQSILDKHAQEYRRTYIKSTDTWSDWKGIGLNPEPPINEIIG